MFSKVAEYYDTINKAVLTPRRREVIIPSLYFLRTCRLKCKRFVKLQEIDIDNDSLLQFACNELENLDSVLEQLYNEFNESELQEVARDYLSNSENYLSGKAVNYPTPNSIVNLSLRILNPKEKERIADYGSGIGRFTLTCCFVEPKVECVGYEIDLEDFLFSKMLSSIIECENAEFENADIFNAIDPETRFDKIFANYSFGIRATSEEIQNRYKNVSDELKTLYKATSLDWAFNYAIIRHLKENGMGVAITSSGSLFNATDSELRKYFVENGYIKAIVALPEKMFGGTFVKTNLIVFGYKNSVIRMIDATKIYQQGRRFNTLSEDNISEIMDLFSNDSEISRSVSVEEIKAKSYNLDPVAYIRTEIILENDVELQSLIVGIRRAAQIPAPQLDELLTDLSDRYACLMIGDIQDSVIQKSCKSIIEIPEKYHKFILHDGDIILSKAPIPIFKSAVYEAEKNQSVVASGNMYIISVNPEKLNPYYLLSFFNSKLGYNRLDAVATGSTVRSLPIEGLKKLRIPYISMEEQAVKGERFKKITQEITELKLCIDRKKEEMEEVF